MQSVWGKAQKRGAPETGFRSASEPVSVAGLLRKSAAVFATDSVAAKPVKPCDGGVFQGLNLLSKKE